MNSKHWTTKLHTIPHRILDHPFSGAYALWVVLADAAARGGTTSTLGQLTSLGSLGVLTLAITAGRKPILRQTVMRKVNQLSRVTQKYSKYPPGTRQEGLRLAFDALYQLGNVDVTRRLVDSLRELDRSVVTSWGFSAGKNSTMTPTELAGQLIDGALYSALVNPPGLSGVLPKRVQDYLLARHPEWVAEYPQHFSGSCVDHAMPGLLTAALTVHGLAHASADRRAALSTWLQRSADPSLSDSKYQDITMCEVENSGSTIDF